MSRRADGQVALDLTTGWDIHAGGGEVALVAGEELASALAGVEPTGARPVSFVLELGDPAGEGWSCVATGREVRLTGHGPRGLLQGLYALLRSAGWSWPAPGRVAPPGDLGRLWVPARAAGRPAFAHGSLILGSAACLDEVGQWAAWAARSGLDTVFFHVAPATDVLDSAMHWQDWVSARPTALAACRRLGLRVEVGGHLMSRLVRDPQPEPQRDLQPAPPLDPGMFRMVDGVRTPDHNLCPSSPAALAALAAGARQLAAEHPGVDVLHVWADDLPGGGWCACPACVDRSPAEQALLATNAVARGVREVAPRTEVSLLAYHDTEVVSPGAGFARPEPNVNLLWAPRRRCYGHPADDPGCPVNAPRYGAGFAALAADARAAGFAGVDVFEYYLDTVLFPALLPPFDGLIRADAAGYRAAGVRTFGALLVGPGAVGQAPANARAFSAAVRGEPAAPSGAATLLEQACALALRTWPAVRSAEELAPTTRGLDRVREGYALEPTDPALVDPAVLQDLLAAQDEAVAMWVRARDAARSGGAPPDAAGERAAALEPWLRFRRGRVAAHLAARDGDAAGVARAVDAALSACDVLLAAQRPAGRAGTVMQAWLWAGWRAPLYRLRLGLADPGQAGPLRAQRDSEFAALAAVLLAGPADEAGGVPGAG